MHKDTGIYVTQFFFCWVKTLKRMVRQYLHQTHQHLYRYGEEHYVEFSNLWMHDA